MLFLLNRFQTLVHAAQLDSVALSIETFLLFIELLLSASQPFRALTIPLSPRPIAEWIIEVEHLVEKPSWRRC